MSTIISIKEYPVRAVINSLLEDKSTKKNIIWATDAYSNRGPAFSDTHQITKESLLGLDALFLQSRIEKEITEQKQRTKNKAEVFTPVWLCNKMNNCCDAEWFHRKDIFNIECSDHQWNTVDERVTFPKEKSWKEYVDTRSLEITCGEAPFIVSRYNAATGEIILPLVRRIGILDRKLRVVNENTANEEEWLKWAFRAFQSCYGYEYQGDSLLIARINMLLTFYDYYKDRWTHDPDVKLIKKIANIISWNIWQMDGFKDSVPHGKPHEEFHQTTLFEWMTEPEEETDNVPLPCIIKDWRSKISP